MPTQTKMSPDEIRSLRAENAKMRERDFATLHNISEAELIAAYCGHGTIRLNPDIDILLNGLPALGEVMALTRNESAVHEKIGPYVKPNIHKHAAIVLGELIDLRIFHSKWAFGFAVEKQADDGAVRRSLQFFDANGTAVHKVHLRPATDIDAYRDLVAKLTSKDQSPLVDVLPIEEEKADIEPRAEVVQEDLRAHWSSLTDVHQFMGLLRKFKISRHEAVNLIDRDFAWPLEVSALSDMLNNAVSGEVPIMAFVGSNGCIQIHTGPIQNVKPMGPWINIMDPTFHMHLRNDHIVELWAVRKPTSDGHVTSLEAYDANNQLIIQFFGQRQEGTAERPEWRALVEALTPIKQTDAA